MSHISRPLSCPFCGGHGVSVSGWESGVFLCWVKCGKCGARGPKLKSRADTLSLWNEVSRTVERSLPGEFRP